MHIAYTIRDVISVAICYCAYEVTGFELALEVIVGIRLQKQTIIVNLSLFFCQVDDCF